MSESANGSYRHMPAQNRTFAYRPIAAVWKPLLERPQSGACCRIGLTAIKAAVLAALMNRCAENRGQRHFHYGSHPYYEIGAFRDAAANLDALQTFAGVYGRSRDQRAKHYRQTYSEPVLPPIWTMKEFLTFGAAARLFQCLNGTIKTTIATQFGVRSDLIFTSWLECLVDLRNMCAHHDRLRASTAQCVTSS